MGKQNNGYTNWNNGCGCETYTEPAACACEGKAVPCGCDVQPAVACGCEAAENSCHLGKHGKCGRCDNETHIIYETCDGYKEVSVASACQQEMMPGRVLDVNATLMNVCPGRRSALGLTLTELDGSGAEHPCGFQAVTVPAHHGRCNQDIAVDTVRFILPENECAQQQRRHFIVRTQHHYLDAANIWNNSWGN